MTIARSHPAPTRPDFHCALLWLRSLEIHTGMALELNDTEVVDLFSRYRSPWKT